MPDNLYSSGQKILSKDGRDNWDAIFGKKRSVCKCQVCGKEVWYGEMCHGGQNMSDRFWFAQDIKDNSK